MIKCKTYLLSDTWCKRISTDMFHNLGNKEQEVNMNGAKLKLTLKKV